MPAVQKAEPHTPTAGMKAEAKRGLAWRKEFNRGGTQVGVSRARDILNAKSLPLDTVKRMYSYFSRHEVDKKAEGFERGEKGYPSAGRIAWALWGGDAGFSWSKKLVQSHKGTDKDMDEETLKGYGLYDEEKAEYGDTAQGIDAMTHLLMAYRLMMDHEECWTLLKPLMRLIHRLEEKMLNSDEPEMDSEDHHDDDYYVESDKEIKQENGQFCVYSMTGRSFGCYASEQDAISRLQQIERFKLDKLEPTSTKQLVKYHDRLHALKEVGAEHIVVHNLIEDELESRGIAPPYDLGNVEKKLEMLSEPMTGITPVIKQDEQRYTLGPVYVPDREDAHGEFTDSITLQKALWNWVRKGDRRIFIQHSDKVAGEMVETLTWPFPIEVDLEVPNQGVTKQTFPADTPFLGVVWEDWAWELVKAGELRGYSIGGRAKRIEADLPEPALI